MAFSQSSGPYYRQILANHDFDSVTTTYAVLAENWSSATGNAKTTGSTATVDAASGSPFAALSTPPGAVISLQPCIGGGCAAVERYVLTRASGAQITVDQAVDWSGNGSTGFAFQYRNLAAGTGAGDGWFGIGGLHDPVLTFQIEQLSVSAGSVAVTVECKSSSPWAAGAPVYPPAGGSGQCGTGLFTTAGSGARCVVLLPQIMDGRCRIGVSLTDDGGDTGANLERVSAFLTGWK